MSPDPDGTAAAAARESGSQTCEEKTKGKENE